MVLQPTPDGSRYDLTSPTAMPNAGGFLWNRRMMVQVTCRGYATAQFMQPEPAKYSHAPNMEARTFMQPEQGYYAHHPGRFVYVKDEDTGEFFSAPHEPVRRKPDVFRFSHGQSDIRWSVENLALRVEMTLSLPPGDDVVELWTVKVTNLDTSKDRNISIYPYFVVGYMSWMNQSAEWRPGLGALVASCITPYQRAEEYWKRKALPGGGLRDKTYFVCGTTPTAWEAKQTAFEGEGGLHAPSAVTDAPMLAGGDARYETPVAAVQYRETLGPANDDEESEKSASSSSSTREYKFLFGPARDEGEIAAVRARYLGGDSSSASFEAARAAYAEYVARGSRACLRGLETPDPVLDNMMNHWLPRQMFYHGDANRLTTDPQTRNFLQDGMGMAYLPGDDEEGTVAVEEGGEQERKGTSVARAALLLALSQQKADGALPDGTLLTRDAELKYINQVPHTDHCVWLPVALELYLRETGDIGVLGERVASFFLSGEEDGDEETEKDQKPTVLVRLCRAMDWLLGARDHRGLSYLAQGDWCDPLNMAGIKGRGVSGWLTVATAYALLLTADICDAASAAATTGDVAAFAADAAKRYRDGARACNEAANRHLWRDRAGWYARGITDDDVVFGTEEDAEGSLWLNPQAWAILSGAAADEEKNTTTTTTTTEETSSSSSASSSRIPTLLAHIDKHLLTPFGPAMFGPPYRGMREDVGRVTQKFPGSAENASVYNHASAFLIHAMYSSAGCRDRDRAYTYLRRMVPDSTDPADWRARGQLPVFIPNYYRGGWREYPDRAGRSSMLFNTGTTGWVYRSVVEGLCGLRGGDLGGGGGGGAGGNNVLLVDPQFPSWWGEGKEVKVVREFRGARFDVRIRVVGGSGEGAEEKNKGPRGVGYGVKVWLDGEELPGPRVEGVEKGRVYKLDVTVPN